VFLRSLPNLYTIKNIKITLFSPIHRCENLFLTITMTDSKNWMLRRLFEPMRENVPGEGNCVLRSS
jgi:hypothetical protein